MHLVDSHRRVERVARRSLVHPVGVVPVVVVAAPHHRAGGRRQLGAARKRVGLVEQRAVARADAELVVSGPVEPHGPAAPRCRVPSERACAGCASPRQSLKSPTTDTADALGAHTAKRAPAAGRGGNPTCDTAASGCLRGTDGCRARRNRRSRPGGASSPVESARSAGGSEKACLLAAPGHAVFWRRRPTCWRSRRWRGAR